MPSISETDMKNELDRLMKLKNSADPCSPLQINMDDPTVSYETVKKNYRKLTLYVHPDRCNHANAKEAFHVLERAYSKISSEESFNRYRSAYIRKKEREKKIEEIKKAELSKKSRNLYKNSSLLPDESAILQYKEETILNAERIINERNKRKREEKELVDAENELNETLRMQREELNGFSF